MKAAAKNRLVQEWMQSKPCFWCGKAFGVSGKSVPTLEHFFPRSRGGQGGADNCVVAHMGCNARRKNRLPSELEMRAFVQTKGPRGIRNLRKFAAHIETTLSSQAASQPVTPTVSGRSLSIQVAG